MLQCAHSVSSIELHFELLCSCRHYIRCWENATPCLTSKEVIVPILMTSNAINSALDEFIKLKGNFYRQGLALGYERCMVCMFEQPCPHWDGVK